MADENIKLLHRVIRLVAGWATWSFFSDVRIVGAERVPRDGPMIVVATHHNMMLDPAVLSSYFPYGRILHYWTKASLFANPVLAKVLYSSGNIPVDRNSGDRRVLLAGTFSVLAKGGAVALFPEGTSYTQPRIMQVKDGASWAAMEYLKWEQENGGKVCDVKIVPTAIVYTNKSKYRSEVIIEFGNPISAADFADQFLAPEEGSARATVKRLTQQIEDSLISLSVNAPDWDTLYAARMARALLWERGKLNLDDFVSVTQTLVDIFATPNATPNVTYARRRLLEYYSLLQTSGLNNSSLAALPLPPALDPRRSTPLPSRLRTLFALLTETLPVLVRLPFFVVPLLIHAPAYLASRSAAKIVEHEEETQAQNKVVVGLVVLMLLIYPAAFMFLWALFYYTPSGACISASIVWLFAFYHNKMIDDYYRHAKQLMTAWRVLVGIWAPKRTELSLTALQQFLVPQTPPESQWINKNKNKSRENLTAGSGSSQSSPASPGPTNGPLAPSPGSITTAPPSLSLSSSPTPSSSTLGAPKKPRRPPTRRFIRHVLRARAESVRVLAALVAQLQQAPSGHRLRASAHLAHTYGGGFTHVRVVDESIANSDTLRFYTVSGERLEKIGVNIGRLLHDSDESRTSGEGHAARQYEGYRYAREVLSFLRERGAALDAHALPAHVSPYRDYWTATAALSSDGESLSSGCVR